MLIIAGSFYPDVSGGPSMTLYWLAKSLKENGIEPVILTTDRGLSADIPRNTWLDRDFGRIQYVRTTNNERAFTLLWKCLLTIPKYRTIYLPSFFYPLSFVLGILIAAFSRKKLIWGPRGETSPDALRFSARKKKPVLWLIRRLRHRIIFHATSDAEVSDIRAALGDDVQIELIPNGIYLPVRCTPGPDAFRRLLYVGRIHPIKGIDRLIEALHLCPAFINSDRQLILAGYAQEGYDQVLKDLIAKYHLDGKVHFYGRISGREKDQLMADAVCLILPSHSENFGAVVAEALAQGTPCIASLGTPWQLLQTSGAGKHVDNTPEQLAGAINDILTLTPDAYSTMRHRARELAENQIDIARYIPQWRQLMH